MHGNDADHIPDYIFIDFEMTQNMHCWPINSVKPSDAYMRQQTMPPVVQITVCRLVGPKPICDPMLECF